jgi:cytochrome c oxidase assembly protein subunit 15
MSTASALVNLDPAWGFVGLGAVLAAVPLSWWAVKSSGASPVGRWHALALLTLFLTFDLVLFGSFTRLTDSGLGCPDWPGCYGNVTAWGAKEHIDAAQAAMPSGPVTTSKAWIEMIHRKMATVIGALITLLMALTIYWRKKLPFSPALPVFTFVWVCVQGTFGALTVTWKLFPAIVTLHLLGGMVLLLLLAVQVGRNALALGKLVGVTVNARLRTWLWLSLALVFVQMALGAWVSTNYAVLACTEFPLCQGQWWPPMSFADGFQFWHELGKLANGQSIDMMAITAIHMTHRSFAFGVVAVIAVLCVHLREHVTLRRYRIGLMAVLTLQIGTGLANVVFDWPLLAALLHTGGAAGLVLLLTLLAAQTSPQANAATSADMTDNRQAQTA